jgi:hypothetical protein
MAVPEQVRKQTEAVQQLYKELNNPDEVTSPEGEVPPVEAETPVLSEVIPADSANENAPSSTPTEPVVDDPNSETFEQRWRTAQGMYNADVPRLQAQNTDLGNRLQQMEQLISTMQAAPQPNPEPTPAPVSSLTAEEVDEYGESIDIMRKVSSEIGAQYEQRLTEMQNTINQLQGTVVPRVEQIAQQQAQSAEQVFWSDLTSVVPDWRTINDNQDFQAWLLQTDKLSGLTRQTYLDDAQHNLDSDRVAGFFTSWTQETGTPLAQPNRSAPNSELELQIAPGKSRGSGTPQGEVSKTYTRADITKFFEKVRTGKFAGKEKERDAIERDIFAAQADGRIVSA